MNECANLKAIAGVRCSMDIYNSHERGWFEFYSGREAVAQQLQPALLEKERYGASVG